MCAFKKIARGVKKKFARCANKIVLLPSCNRTEISVALQCCYKSCEMGTKPEYSSHVLSMKDCNIHQQKPMRLSLNKECVYFCISVSVKTLQNGVGLFVLYSKNPDFLTPEPSALTEDIYRCQHHISDLGDVSIQDCFDEPACFFSFLSELCQNQVMLPSANDDENSDAETVFGPDHH